MHEMHRVVSLAQEWWFNIDGYAVIEDLMMHTPHIKPQSFGYSVGFQTRAAKAKPAERELLLPVSEWGRDENRQNRQFERQRPEALSDIAEEAFSSVGAAFASAEVHREQLEGSFPKGAGNSELQALVDAVSGGKTATCDTACARSIEAEPSLETLLENAAHAFCTGS